jgi:uncharacterized protein YxjI
MRYQLKEKIWTFGDNYVIRDGNGQDAYFVKGKFFSWGDQLSFQDLAGRELAFISQKLLTLMPKYELHRSGQHFADIVKEFSWFKSSFTLDVPGPNDYRITGSFWDHEYSFERDGRQVAAVSKQFWSWGDTYGVDIASDEDDVAILATVVVIDLVCHDDKNSSN